MHQHELRRAVYEAGERQKKRRSSVSRTNLQNPHWRRTDKALTTLWNRYRELVVQKANIELKEVVGFLQEDSEASRHFLQENREELEELIRDL